MTIWVTLDESHSPDVNSREEPGMQTKDCSDPKDEQGGILDLSWSHPVCGAIATVVYKTSAFTTLWWAFAFMDILSHSETYNSHSEEHWLETGLVYDHRNHWVCLC